VKKEPPPPAAAREEEEDDDDDVVVVPDAAADDDDAGVLREIDVYLSPELAEKLYLLQYPSVPPHDPTTTSASAPPHRRHASVAAGTVARMKPRHGILELEQPLPPKPPPSTTTAAEEEEGGDDSVVDDESESDDDSEEDGDGGIVGGNRRGRQQKQRRRSRRQQQRRTFYSQTIPIQTHLCLGKLLRVDGDGGGGGGGGGGSSGTTASDEKMSLHLVPLGHVSQMRPSFRHVDHAADRQFDGSSYSYPHGCDSGGSAADLARSSSFELEQRMLAAADPSGAAAEVVVERKPVVFQRKESERAALARKSSYAYKKASEDSEPWRPLSVIVAASGTAAGTASASDDEDDDSDAEMATARREELDRVLCSEPDQYVLHDERPAAPSSSSEAAAAAAYVHSLNYLPHHRTKLLGNSAVIEAQQKQRQSPDGKPKADLTWIVSRLTRLMLTGYPIPYSVLRSSLLIGHDTNVRDIASADCGGWAGTTASALDDETLLKALSACAVMVRGNFCLRSKFLPIPKSLQRARTFVLLLLQQLDATTGDAAVQRRKLDPVFDGRVSSERLLALLGQVAKRGPDGGWVLKVEDDVGFQERFPAHASKYNDYWKKQQTTRFKKELQIYRSSS